MSNRKQANKNGVLVDGIVKPYEYIPYPKWINVDGKQVLVQTKEDHDKLIPKKPDVKKSVKKPDAKKSEGLI